MVGFQGMNEAIRQIMKAAIKSILWSRAYVSAFPIAPLSCSTMLRAGSGKSHPQIDYAICPKSQQQCRSQSYYEH